VVFVCAKTVEVRVHRITFLLSFVKTNISMENFGKCQPVTFTRTELTVINLICNQYFDSEIAKELSLRPRTVRKIRESIKSKMNVTSSAGIVIYAFRHDMYQSSIN